jgi:hypothetical protein
LLPWILLGASVVAFGWALIAGGGPLLGVGILGVAVALASLVGNRIVLGDGPPADADQSESASHQ